MLTPYLSMVAVDTSWRAVVVAVSQAVVGGGDSCDGQTEVHAFRLR